MDYNTNRSKLRLPEYGRHIQDMVEYCRAIEDRNERQACAESIVNILIKLFPEEMDAQQYPCGKAWDTLQILSDFSLDVDFPCPVITEENVRPAPEQIPYNPSDSYMKVYGRIIGDMAKEVANMAETPAKDEAVWRVAMQMKKTLFLHNPEAATDYIVLRDLSCLTGGRINLNPETYRLRELTTLQTSVTKPAAKKKKKKK